MSLGIIVICFAWIAHKLVSSNRPTRYAFTASCKALIAELRNCISTMRSCAISFTSLAKGALLISKLVFFWQCLISRRARVPGLYRCFLLVAHCGPLVESPPLLRAPCQPCPFLKFLGSLRATTTRGPRPPPFFVTASTLTCSPACTEVSPSVYSV